jgi:integrase
MKRALDFTNDRVRERTEGREAFRPPPCKPRPPPTRGRAAPRHDRAGGPGAPLSSRSFVENLKAYAKEAGLAGVHLHQTRHTYARIVAEETGSFLEAQEALDHENAATTRVYVQRITVKKDRHGRRVSERMKLRRSGGSG